MRAAKVLRIGDGRVRVMPRAESATMDKITERLLEEFHDKEARTEYADEFLDTSVALQIATLRQERGLTQQELGDLADPPMEQSRISIMEKEGYASRSVRTLRRLAKAFDLPLVIRFESWANFLAGVTKLGRRDLNRPSFDEDPVFNPVVSAAEPPDLAKASDGLEAALATWFNDVARGKRRRWLQSPKTENDLWHAITTAIAAMRSAGPLNKPTDSPPPTASQTCGADD